MPIAFVFKKFMTCCMIWGLGCQIIFFIASIWSDKRFDVVECTSGRTNVGPSLHLLSRGASSYSHLRSFFKQLGEVSWSNRRPHALSKMKYHRMPTLNHSPVAWTQNGNSFIVYPGLSVRLNGAWMMHCAVNGKCGCWHNAANSILAVKSWMWTWSQSTCSCLWYGSFLRFLGSLPGDAINAKMDITINNMNQISFTSVPTTQFALRTLPKLGRVIRTMLKDNGIFTMEDGHQCIMTCIVVPVCDDNYLAACVHHLELLDNMKQALRLS